LLLICLKIIKHIFFYRHHKIYILNVKYTTFIKQPNNRSILRNYYMTFSILALVLAQDSHIKPDSKARGLIWVEGWYQGRYGKFHVRIYLSHILHWFFSSIDIYIAEKIFELTNWENKSLRELPLFNLQIFLFRVLYNDVRKCL
jgi:hypothetical protein